MDEVLNGNGQPAEATTGRARQRPRLPAIAANRCTGCGRCVGACAPQLLSLEVQRWKKSAVLRDAPRCTGCSLCALRCPFDAITMQAQNQTQTPG